MLYAVRLLTFIDLNRTMFCSYNYLVDGLRHSPDTYAHLSYYSQISYRLQGKNGEVRMCRFRLLPEEDGEVQESGQLTEDEQERPWERGRSKGDKRPMDYLRADYINRLHPGTVRYLLQIQLHSGINEDLWNPQSV